MTGWGQFKTQESVLAGLGAIWGPPENTCSPKLLPLDPDMSSRKPIEVGVSLAKNARQVIPATVLLTEPEKPKYGGGGLNSSLALLLMQWEALGRPFISFKGSVSCSRKWTL